VAIHGSDNAFEAQHYLHAIYGPRYAEACGELQKAGEKRDMKLGFLLFDYFPFGGLQRDCLKVATLCAQRGHQVTLFTRTWLGEKAGRHCCRTLSDAGLHQRLAQSRLAEQLAEHCLNAAWDGVIGFNKLPGLDVYYGSDSLYVAQDEPVEIEMVSLGCALPPFQRTGAPVFAAGLCHSDFFF